MTLGSAEILACGSRCPAHQALNGAVITGGHSYDDELTRAYIDFDTNLDNVIALVAAGIKSS